MRTSASIENQKNKHVYLISDETDSFGPVIL